MLNSKIHSRLISIILTAIMVVSCIPFSLWQTSEVYGVEDGDGSAATEQQVQGDDIDANNETSDGDKLKKDKEEAGLLAEADNEDTSEEPTAVAEEVVTKGKKTIKSVKKTIMSMSSSAAAAEPWNGETMSEPEMDDDGYYLISNGAELAYFAEIVNSGEDNYAYGKLTACINLGDCDWVPIGNEDSPYCGMFDGAGHTITGLNVNDYTYAGLFGYIDHPSITGVSVEGSVSGEYAGGIAGYGFLCATEESISYCSNKADITGYYAAGGIMGYEECYTAIYYCSNYGEIIGACFAAGIIGYGFDADISNCLNAGVISCSEEDCNCAGIIGVDYDYWTTLNNCYNNASFDGYAFSGENDISISGVFCNEGDTTEGLDKSGVLGDDDLVGLDEFVSSTKGAFAADGRLAWEAVTHKDEAPATVAEKTEALANLTYRENDYYDEQLAEIDQIIADAKAELMDMTILPSALEEYIEGIQAQINAVKKMDYIDAINNGKKSINDKLTALNEKDYDTEDWQMIEKTASDAKEAIDNAAIDEISGIVNDAVKTIDNVMTKADKSAFAALKEDAKKQVADYIEKVKEEYTADLKLLEGNETALTGLKAKQDAVVKTYFETYLEGGDEAAAVDNMTTKADLEQWVDAAKAVVDEHKAKGLMTKISTAEDLLAFANKVNSSKENSGLYAILTSDIDATGIAWKPIGKSTSYPYSGMFFGNGKTVTLAYTASSSSDATGFFGVTDGAYVEGLTIEGSITGLSTSTSYGTGGIVGRVYANTNNSETIIINCTNKATVTGKNYTGGFVGNVYGYGSSKKAILKIANCNNNGTVNGAKYVGGFVGGVYGSSYVAGMTLSDCINNGPINATNDYVAGIVAYANSSADVIENCRNTANINSTALYIGGIVGYANTKGYSITGCTNTGDLNTASTTTNGATLGGIIACSKVAGSITNCVNSGDILKGGNAGGIGGSLSGAVVKNCYNEGNITSSGMNQNNNGGIAGSFNGTMSYVYNTGVVNVGSRDGYAVGGIVGSIAGSATSLSNAYNIGAVPIGRTDYSSYGYGSITGFKAATLLDGAITNCYALEDTSDYLIYFKGEAGSSEGWKSSDELKSEEMLQLLNSGATAEKGFVASIEGINNGYPTFEWVTAEVIKELASKKQAAIEEIQNRFDPDDYYDPQKSIVIEGVASAIAALNAINNSIGQVDIVKAEWLNTLDSYDNKGRIDTKLDAAQKEACDKLDTYLDFSGYSEAAQNKLESVKDELTETINAGKLEINSITSEQFAANYDAVTEKLTTWEKEIDKIFMDNGIWSGNHVEDTYKPEQVNGVYQISNAVELVWFAQEVTEKNKANINGVLVSDVDLGNIDWTPIGSRQKYYKGKFDGQGHTVSGLKIVVGDGDTGDMGLFGYGENGSMISNLTVKGTITGSGDGAHNSDIGYGGIIGRCGGKIIGCTSYVDINLTDAKNVGGICGNAVYISNCVNKGTVNGGSNVGGIAGNTYQQGIIIYCHNEGNVAGGSVGGILGNMPDGMIRNCSNTGNISGSAAGGIAGAVAGDDETIINVYNTGNITGSTGINTGNMAGGLIGSMGYNENSGMGSGGATYNGLLTNGYSIGTVTNGGAIAGKLTGGTISNCYVASDLELCNKVMTSNTSISQCMNVGADNVEELKGYAAKLGSAFCEDTSNVNDGYPILSTATDSAELTNAKATAIADIWASSKHVNKKSEYGSQYNALLKETENQQILIEGAKSVAEVDELLIKAKATLDAVPTELELQRTVSIEALQKMIDSKLYNDEKYQEATDLLAEAEVKIQSASKTADVSALEKEYAEKIGNVATYPQGAITDLESYMAELSVDAGAVQKLKLQSLVNKAATKIEKAETKEAIDDIVGEYRQMMSESMNQTSLPDISVDEDDSLAKAKAEAYEQVLDAISEGLEDDYRAGHWTQIEAVCTEAATSINVATSQADIDKAKGEAISLIEEIPTDTAITAIEESLDKAKETAYEQLNAFREEMVMLSASDKAKAEVLLDKAEENIEAVNLNIGSASELQSTLEEAIEVIDGYMVNVNSTMNSMFEALKKETWSNDTSEPEQQDGWYIVETPQQLAWIAANVTTGKVKLAADIDLSGAMWKPIGTSEKPFRGTFDGAGYNISNMNIIATEYGNGLFGHIDGATVKNVVVTGTITAYSSANATRVPMVGSIAGEMINSEITSCDSYVNIVSKAKTEDSRSSLPIIGGIVGCSGEFSTYSNIISGCSNNGDITAGVYKNIGGIVGYAYGGTQMLKCSNNGNLAGTTCEDINPNTNAVWDSGIGGLVGYAYGRDVSISHSYNSGNISGMHYVGGIIGQVGSSSSGETTCIKNSYNSGTVNGKAADSTGTIAGYTLSGNYTENIFALEGSGDKPMGYVPVNNMISSVAADVLAAAETVAALNGQEDCFVGAIAGINNGNPVFEWQLIEASSKAKINEYLQDYLNEEDFTEEQWNDIQQGLIDDMMTVIAATTAEGVIEAYGKAIEELEGAEAAIKKALTDQLGAIDVEGYDMASQLEKIASAANAAEAQQILDETMAGVTDFLIDAIPEVKDVNSGDAIAAAREAYDNLTDEQKDYVSKFIALKSAETEYADNSKAAQEVIDQIDALSKITLKDKEAIDAMRTGYDTLTDVQKTFVSEGTYDKLVLAENTLQDLIDKAKEEEEAAKNNQGNKPSAGVSALQSADGGTNGKQIKAAKASDKDNATSNSDESVLFTDDIGDFGSGFLGWKLIPIGIGIVAMLAIAYAIIRWLAAARVIRKK